MPDLSCPAEKVFSWEAARQKVRQVRSEGKKVVFTNGCFDLLHIGHIRYLKAARALGDFLIVGVNNDASVRRLGKGPTRPLVPQDERAEILAALESVDGVVLFSEDTPLQLIQTLRPDVLVKGGDYAPEGIIGRSEVLSWGGKVQVIPFVPGRSTSGLIARILRIFANESGPSTPTDQI
ncbi:rfaE bifunctional protein [Desulfobacca acetoxidans DSM 11109]|uniref:D-glycero-beta-D-manno-heptose 1-phosphate adenylyltransferase n=1 Tax=Desulfobacca acetoxidans (strain ATCC 700848 / DSM 11109 / ASRB2) TaxID=880072 RepID=F2NI68_DESAR|nr:D-glycero-beta-D-manno-heptose 1-phosphate adenylyltransferase [Desulfobacca acetoxidans]AEB09837.1 rfaE bifunctional protein [Desulfobacca acetoxidans DSM 11109]